MTDFHSSRIRMSKYPIPHKSFLLALVVTLGFLAFTGSCFDIKVVNGAEPEELRDEIDAPILFVKRFNYLGIHIYDTFYKWRPGGGIYVLENPSDPPELHRVRPVIDPTTSETLGEGVYYDPDLSYDGARVLFCFKQEELGSTSIYEIGVDGTGLRRLTDPTSLEECHMGNHGGQHDVTPAYLPDGRIVFTTTRFSGLVPCANNGVAIMHVMNADGSNIHPISVNNVNEFDPSLLPDGRIVFGRWEYIDKTALTQQSLWTVFADGTQETALFANNMVHPEAILDIRAVEGVDHLVVGAFTPHNAPPRGTVAMIDTRLGKNDPSAIINFETPDNPTHDRGQSCDPWGLSSDLILYSGQPASGGTNAVMLVTRDGVKQTVYVDPAIDCHSPIPVRPRLIPEMPAPTIDRHATSGRFFVQDIYEGLPDVERGTIKQLRIVEETSRISPTPGGDLNQVFLISAALAFSVKNFIGVVPVYEDGSAYFEVPSGRAVYLQALDAEGRLVRSMRTFIQAAPGTTRSCVGCHEYKYSTTVNIGAPVRAFASEPDIPEPETWGNGYVDYPTMVQPIFDRHCVSCHGGEEDIAGEIDLSGGWTELFNISYENLISRREVQYTATLIAGIDCMNGTANWSAKIFPPYSHGSGSAPLAHVLVSGHEDRIEGLSRTERDLLLAWIDTNGVYFGTWDYSDNGCKTAGWQDTKSQLITAMEQAGCAECHGQNGRITKFESDWFNLRQPEWSRILRAPLAKNDGAAGLEWCRNRPVDPRHERIRIMTMGGYVHQVTALNDFPRLEPFTRDSSGEPVVSFESTEDPAYQKMLSIIERGRGLALSAPRVDMPGAVIQPGASRQSLPKRLPEILTPAVAEADQDGVVRLTWERTFNTIGLNFELHRGSAPGFMPTPETLLASTPRFEYVDYEAPSGIAHYVLLVESSDGLNTSPPLWTSIAVESPTPPQPVERPFAASDIGEVSLQWESPSNGSDDDFLRATTYRYNVYRAQAGTDDYELITTNPIATNSFRDATGEPGTTYDYVVRTVSRRGVESSASPAVSGAAAPEMRDPVFVFPTGNGATAQAEGVDGATIEGVLDTPATIGVGVLNLSNGGSATFADSDQYDLTRRLTVACWIRLDEAGQMPIIISHGLWNNAGWFLQQLNGRWRWHIGGVDCDGGTPTVGQWRHMTATYDGQTARLYENGRMIAEASGSASLTPWTKSLVIGQYSGGPDASFQTTGRIADVRIYACQLNEEEILELAASPPGE